MWDNQKWYQLFECVILIAQCVHFDIWNKMRKKNFFKNFSKNFLPKKISYTPPYEFWRPRKKIFFSFYSIYQNVRTEQLKWRVRKVDITSGCLTIMVYFCNNEWVFILTKVQLYCVFVFGNYEVSNTFLLLHRAYILISGMKFGKFDCQFSSFLCFHIGIFWK